MAFVNEYASDEDIKKYKLNEIWDRYHIHAKGKYYRGKRPYFTIDRERDIFLMTVSGEKVNDVFRYKFLLLVQGFDVVACVNKVKGGSSSTKDRPYVIIWDLSKIDKPDQLDVSEEDLVEILKKAITVYGRDGIREQIPDTVVKFK